MWFKENIIKNAVENERIINKTKHMIETFLNDPLLHEEEGWRYYVKDDEYVFIKYSSNFEGFKDRLIKVEYPGINAYVTRDDLCKYNQILIIRISYNDNMSETHKKLLENLIAKKNFLYVKWKAHMRDIMNDYFINNINELQCYEEIKSRKFCVWYPNRLNITEEDDAMIKLIDDVPLNIGYESLDQYSPVVWTNDNPLSVTINIEDYAVEITRSWVADPDMIQDWPPIYMRFIMKNPINSEFKRIQTSGLYRNLVLRNDNMLTFINKFWSSNEWVLEDDKYVTYVEFYASEETMKYIKDRCNEIYMGLFKFEEFEMGRVKYIISSPDPKYMKVTME